MSYAKAAALLDRGVSKPSLFKLEVPQVSNMVRDHLEFFCTTTAIPEVRMNTVVVGGHEFMGIERDQPTQVIYGKPFSIQVIERTDFRVYKDIRDWINLTGSRLNQGTTEGGPTQGPRSTRMQYYKTYVKEMTLKKLEYSTGIDVDRFTGEQEQLVGYRNVMTVTFLQAYPVGISQINLNTESTNSFTSYQVDFSYESYNLQYTNINMDVPSDIDRFITLGEF